MTPERIASRRAPSMRRAVLDVAAFTVLLLASVNAEVMAQEVQAKEPNRGGALDLAARDPAVARQRLTAAPGYEVTLFASERDFPIGNPVAMAFDSRGRLWVATAPSYPHYDPASPPNDRLIVLEDTNGDGRADRHTVFADSLYLPLGFELGHGGVFIAQQPNLLFLRDRDGDGVADERRILLHGFGTEDSHHALHAFTWGPDGALYMQEGTFHHSQVETPYGPVRAVNGGVFRYEPGTERLSVYVSYPFANPWGHAFDRWGQNFIADASDGSNYFALPISGRLDYPRKHLSMQVFTRSRVRPTAGAEFVSSRHFPDDVQGNFLLTNVIGFQGIKSHRMLADGSGFTTEDSPPLLISSDINFRPIDMEFGPDGALYVVDWFNPLIGHMQYSMRDPRRDRTHGRIWRVTAKGRPLLVPVDLSTISVAALLERLQLPEDRERYRVRRELRSRERSEVARELTRWTAALDSSAAGYEHLLLEALWVHRSHGIAAPRLHDRLLNAKDHRARAAAVRVLRFERRAADVALPLLRRFVSDPHALVRLEAVVALGDIRSPDAAVAALEVLRHPRDYYLDYALGETITTLEADWKPALLSGAPLAGDNAAGLLFLLDRLGPDEVGRVARSPAVNRALLQRGGVRVDVRRAVLADLVIEDRRSAAAQLLDAMRALDTVPGAVATADELAGLLAERSRDELRSARRDIQMLAVDGRTARLREAAFAALMVADGEVDTAWSIAATRGEGLVDLLNSARFLPAGPVRDALRARALTLARGSAPSVPSGIRARYVRIEQPGCCETQSLAEVEVLDAGTNVALRGAAEQKSTAPGGEAARAVDGNSATLFRQGSVSQSQVLEADPWWEVDLRETRSIDRVVIWRRSDAQLGGDMEGFHVRLLDGDRRAVWQGEKLSAAAQPIVVIPGSAAPSVRRAAVRALAVLGGDDAARAAMFGELLDRGVELDLAAAGLVAAAGALPAGTAATEALQRLARHAASLPESDQGGPTMVGIRALAAARAAAGSAVAARTVGELERLAPKRVVVRAVPAEMRFDVQAFSVEPGRAVELVLENPDHMPHNLVLTARGAADRVGRAADAMAARPDGFARQFVPETSEVLHATRLLASGERAVLRFRAPTAAGAYPYICSFPGHWATMRGAMTVTDGAASAPSPSTTRAP